ncbi:TolB family protein [Amycolatopsis sp. CA-230715]|uniref:TolB family protein n=1 Tax=Amycolatopsis sp. CA-230715 TaxID=2745196 RepID=UPI001C0169B3|nr:hypothetical protein [Amycolatopsis sp. CA-230715]
MRSRWLIVLVTVLVLAGAAIGYTWYAREKTARHGDVNVVPVVSGQALSVPSPGQVLFRNTAAGPDYGRVAQVPAASPGAPRHTAGLSCDRFAAAGGKALCLAARPGVLPPVTDITVLDKDLRVLRTFDLPGSPSRARLSPSGRMAAWTLFVTGDSYAATGFSTRAGILDIETGELVKTVEEMPLQVNGEQYFSADVNYWGITFASNDDRFYLTMASKGKTYLVEADFRAYRGRALHENVECPSLSPDGSRVAYKKRVSADQSAPWRLAVLELASGKETVLAETRSVDDQAAWLDGKTVLYSLPGRDGSSDIWSVPADGTGAPALFVTGGASPAVGR